MPAVAADSAATFRDRLVAAWSDSPVPVITEITTHRCLECDEIAEYFGGRPWAQFTNVRRMTTTSRSPVFSVRRHVERRTTP